MMDITPSMKAKMISTINTMKDKNKSLMMVDGTDCFYVSLDQEHEDLIVLGGVEIEEIKYFLCQRLF